MRLRQLEYFIAIADTGSFSAAAARLYVAQPSLSQQIRTLERELGAELFDRVKSGVELTAAGRVFLPHAKKILGDAEVATQSVADVVHGKQGDVHILTVKSVASGVLPLSVARWHDTYPTTVLRMHDFSHRRKLEDAARDGRGDMAIGPRPDAWAGPISCLGYEEMLVVGRESHDGHRQRVESDELARSKWILFEREQGMSEVTDWLAAKIGFVPVAVARTGQVNAALQLAVEGVGLTIAPENAIPNGWSGHGRRIGPGVFRELCLYSRSAPSQLAAKYWDLLAETKLPLAQETQLPAGALTL